MCGAALCSGSTLEFTHDGAHVSGAVHGLGLLGLQMWKSPVWGRLISPVGGALEVSLGQQ